ncbi:diacylglycerol kinase [Nitrincola tibetensis]|uniref:Diacylglycerol kinase n=1 Tax=Nitrincola tibetensis TaxID=2219697 RepID=A0A364NN71_9GAMM|nr:diacylglycerol kinase [Nitrincola tibetensis]RAU18559.1 diacylglycerol kinase [Nitrincola tibetensis]
MTIKATGLSRFYYATCYSLKGLVGAYRSEPAFRYETWIVCGLTPFAFLLAQSTVELILLIASLLLILIFELINTAIEAVVDRAGKEHHELAGLAKDTGSAAVFLCLLLATFVWGALVWQNVISSI